MVFPIPESLPYKVGSEFWGKQLNPNSELIESQVNADITMWLVNSQFRRYKGQRLWEEFQEWYEDWTDATFKIAHREALKLVRIQLILHGFQVRQIKGSNNYAKVLAELISKDKSDERTKEIQEEADRLKEEYEDMYEIIAPKKLIKIQAPPTIELFEQIRQDEQQQRNLSQFPPDSTMPDRTTRQNTPHTAYGRNLLLDLMKVYNNNEFKYSGGEYDFLNKKLQIFYELCSKVGIHPNEYETAFSTMLQGSALSFYFDRISNRRLKFEEMITLTKAHFETEERRQKYLTEWCNTTFQQIIRKHPDKSLSEQLEKLFDTLRTLQYGLVDSYQSELMLRDQVINACRDVPECNLVLLRPATTYEGLCADLRNAIGQAERMRSTNTYIADSMINNLPGTEIYWTGRTNSGRGSYRNRGQYRARSRGRVTPSRLYSSANSSKRLQYSQTLSCTSIQKCFVCKQSGCWSTNHTKEERKTKFNQYMVEQEMDEEIFEQYLLKYEGASESQYEKDEISEEDDTFEYPKQNLQTIK